MANAPRTSFIPKQNTAQRKMPAPKRKRTFNIFNFITFVVFLAAVIAAGLVFLWESRATTELEQSKADLAEIRNTFSRGDIESLRELDRRITVAHSILRQHLSPTLVFDMLERRTQGEVQFRSFLYERGESGNVVLVLDGVAPRFNTVALQSQEFVESSLIEQAFFTNMDIVIRETEEERESEEVQFRVTSSVDTDLIQYSAVPKSVLEPEANSFEGAGATSTATTTDENAEVDGDEESEDTADTDTEESNQTGA